MTDTFFTLLNTGFAQFIHQDGVYEIDLPEWSGFLSHDEAECFIARLRGFCDQADAALKDDQSEGTETR